LDTTTTTVQADDMAALASGMYAPHEIMEAHEILVQKNVCVTKSTTMQMLAGDPQLKELLQQDVSMSKQAIQELQAILSRV
jgi:similar to spore coat protein